MGDKTCQSGAGREAAQNLGYAGCLCTDCLVYRPGGIPHDGHFQQTRTTRCAITHPLHQSPGAGAGMTGKGACHPRSAARLAVPPRVAAGAACRATRRWRPPPGGRGWCAPRADAHLQPAASRIGQHEQQGLYALGVWSEPVPVHAPLRQELEPLQSSVLPSAHQVPWPAKTRAQFTHLTRCLSVLDQYLLHMRAQLQPPAVLLQAPHEGVHHGLAAATGELQVAVGAVPAAGVGIEGSRHSGRGIGWADVAGRA